MDAVRSTIEGLGGSVELTTDHGKGTTTVLTVPMTAAVQRVLLVEVSGERVALPIAKVERIVEVPRDSVEDSGGEMFTRVEGEPMLVLDLGQCIELERRDLPDPVPLAVTDVRGMSLAEVTDLFHRCAPGHEVVKEHTNSSGRIKRTTYNGRSITIGFEVTLRALKQRELEPLAHGGHLTLAEIKSGKADSTR